MFKCEKCGKEYPDKVLEEHLKLKHSQEIDRIQKESDSKIDEKVENELVEKLEEMQEENKKKIDVEVNKRSKAKDNQIESLDNTIENLNKTIMELNIKAERDSKNFENALKKTKHLSPKFQGEVQEQLIEDILKEEFINDYIEPVDRGVEGGDCIQNIKESILKDLEPKILYESKDTQRFDEKWVRKLADDMELSKAAKGVIITKALPKDFKAGCVTRLNNKIWIIPFKKETIILTATSLRDQLVQVAIKNKLTSKSPEHIKKLWDYCMSDEFVLKVQKNIQDVEKIKEMFQSIKKYVDNKVKEGMKTVGKMSTNVKAIDNKIKSFGKLIKNKDGDE